ncbi:hypothetical protein J2T02_005735, partial [Chitinophaga terrae (ex Kim and Jung 2007)]|nr:hypothetical protein [Chitinophaga terrae (ex Kim and Jung 2007)]
AGSASGRQNQKWKARGDSGGRTKMDSEGMAGIKATMIKNSP